MAKLSPAELTKNIERITLLKEILTTGGFLYKTGEVTKKKVAANDLRNKELIKILSKATQSNLSIVKNELKGKEVFFENTETGVSLSNIEKDSRFVEVNLGHTFEMVFAAAAIAAIKLRPASAASRPEMPRVEEKHIKQILLDITNNNTENLFYKAPGYSLETNGMHNDLLYLNFSKNSIAYKGVEKFIKDSKEYERKKDKLITPVLRYVNSSEILIIRSELFYNGVIDNYIVDMVGGEQQKPDVKIIIKRDKETIQTKLISLKLNSLTFGSVKGGDEKSLKLLFSKFNINIKIPKSIKENKVVYAYEKAKNIFNRLTLDEQLEAIQFALNQFYAGSQDIIEGFEVLKFSKNKTASVYKRMFQNFTENYTKNFSNKKMSVELSKSNSGIALIFKFPNNKSFLKIRNRIAEGNIRHEIEEMAGIQSLIGTTSL